jgi:hypothetical protein
MKVAANDLTSRPWMRLLALALGILGSAGMSRAEAVQLSEPPIPGTYEILICRGLCASATSPNVVVRGHVVLFARALDRRTVERLDDAYGPTTAGERPNGCYELEPVHPGGVPGYIGYAGTVPFGVTGWYPWDGSVVFALYHSPDAGYDAVVKPFAGGLFGQGRSWGVGAAAQGPADADTVVARRTGEAELALCEQWSARRG